jgi:zona occludens toxin
MAIYVHTGYPGAGKSHALVKDIIVPAVMAGRRVLTNIDGINADAIFGYCAERVKDGQHLGSVHYFDGQKSLEAGFWPTEIISDENTTVKGGDLIVFDEWRLYFKNRGNGWAPDEVVKFMRWHRHLTHEKGYSTDVHIGTQLATDLHPDIRGLCERSYKYQKLRAVGLDNQYSWKVWQGHLQPKGEHYANGTGTYDKEIFPLYSSSQATAGSHAELATNNRDNIWRQPSTIAAIVAPIVLVVAGLWALSGVYGDDEKPKLAPEQSAPAQGGAIPAPTVQQSEFRIVGHIEGENGSRVVVVDDKGATQILTPENFDFDMGRPVSGTVDGKRAIASDGLTTGTNGMIATPSPFGGDYK